MRYANKEDMKRSREILQYNEILDIKNEDEGVFGFETSPNWDFFPENDIDPEFKYSSAYDPSLQGVDSI